MGADYDIPAAGVMMKEEEEKLIEERVAVVDFEMLCSRVALQTNQGNSNLLSSKLEGVDFQDDLEYAAGAGAGVFRMWEGDLFHCLDHPRLALQSSCCPCYQFGKNMRRAGFGPCFLQGLVYFLIAVTALANLIAFLVTKKHCFLYLGVGFALSIGTYLGFYRTLIRKKFNIMGSESSLDDCVYHLICPCCALSQESRTLEMNNVQDGIWRGRGDTICIGGYSEGSKAFFELSPPPLVSIKPHEPLVQQSP